LEFYNLKTKKKVEIPESEIKKKRSVRTTSGGIRQERYAVVAAIDKHFGHPAHMPRAGLPDEIGPVVAFLASRRNSYMTGANINVDGGSDFT